MQAAATNDPPQLENPAWSARKLLRAARVGTLATQSAGQPSAGLVTPATTAECDILLLLSDLSEHTRQLRQHANCGLLVASQPLDANPQTAPRLTCLGQAYIDDDPALRARYLAVHPYAALYADFGDFHLWRMKTHSLLYVGGFARATRLDGTALRPDPGAIASLAAAAHDIMAHCNSDHPDALRLLSGDSHADVQMVGVDVDGCDLATGGGTQRLAWTEPAETPDAVRAALITLLAARRQ